MLIRTAAPKVNKGAFKKGEDSRRHELTHAERCKGGTNGFAAMCESLERRFPGADVHFLACAILGSKVWYKLPQIQELLNHDVPIRADAALDRFMRD